MIKAMREAHSIVRGDTPVQSSCGNIFADIGLENAAELFARA
jgi:hypothetical protein